MRLLGFDITRAKPTEKALHPVADYRGGGLLRILESFPGAWQRNIEIDQNLVLSYHAVYACMTLIASDIAKLRVKLVAQDDDGIWTETESPAYSPVLRKPNPTQTRIQFWETWILSKLMRGNTYILKQDDRRNVVTRLYVLDPNKVMPLVSDDGSVFYELSPDNLSAISDRIIVPARNIIHDRMNCLFHPLVGISPLWANGLAATQGLRIQNNSAQFFGNRSMPGAILTAPGHISDDTAHRLKAEMEQGFSGENVGRLMVAGDGLTFNALSFTPEDAQLIEQLKLTAEMVCSTFHLPPYKIGVGPLPSYNNVQALNVEYYAQCLQKLIEDAEECLDDGLGIGWSSERKDGVRYGTEFDVRNLLRMDTLTQVQSLREEVGAGITSPNEARKELDRKPVPGGAMPYLQQQNYSLEALAKRDAMDDPFALDTPAALPAPSDQPPDESEDDDDAEAKALMAGAMLRKELMSDIRAAV